MICSMGYLIIEDGTRFNITHVVFRDEQIWIHAEAKYLTRPAGRIGFIDIFGEDDTLIYRMESDSYLGECKKQRWVPFEVNMRVNNTTKPDDLEPSWRRS